MDNIMKALENFIFVSMVNVVAFLVLCGIASILDGRKKRK